MKGTVAFVGCAFLSVAAVVHTAAQGYLVPNGITYAGFNGLGYGISVVHDPTNRYAE